jgi:hypothetical protein
MTAFNVPSWVPFLTPSADAVAQSINMWAGELRFWGLVRRTLAQENQITTPLSPAGAAAVSRLRASLAAFDADKARYAPTIQAAANLAINQGRVDRNAVPRWIYGDESALPPDSAASVMSVVPVVAAVLVAIAAAALGAAALVQSITNMHNGRAQRERLKDATRGDLFLRNEERAAQGLPPLPSLPTQPGEVSPAGVADAVVAASSFGMLALIIGALFIFSKGAR